VAQKSKPDSTHLSSLRSTNFGHGHKTWFGGSSQAIFSEQREN